MLWYFRGKKKVPKNHPMANCIYIGNVSIPQEPGSYDYTGNLQGGPINEVKKTPTAPEVHNSSFVPPTAFMNYEEQKPNNTNAKPNPNPKVVKSLYPDIHPRNLTGADLFGGLVSICACCNSDETKTYVYHNVTRCINCGNSQRRYVNKDEYEKGLYPVLREKSEHNHYVKDKCKECDKEIKNVVNQLAFHEDSNIIVVKNYSPFVTFGLIGLASFISYTVGWIRRDSQ